MDDTRLPTAPLPSSHLIEVLFIYSSESMHVIVFVLLIAYYILVLAFDSNRFCDGVYSVIVFILVILYIVLFLLILHRFSGSLSSKISADLILWQRVS